MEDLRKIIKKVLMENEESLATGPKHNVGNSKDMEFLQKLEGLKRPQTLFSYSEEKKAHNKAIDKAINMFKEFYLGLPRDEKHSISTGPR